MVIMTASELELIGIVPYALLCMFDSQVDLALPGVLA